MHHHCIKGMLSYLILWILRNKAMTGSEIANELEKRKGSRPSPGTIYPALKELKVMGLITSDKDKRYSLTVKGRKSLEGHCAFFCRLFYDVNDMFKCCKGGKCHPEKQEVKNGKKES